MLLKEKNLIDATAGGIVYGSGSSENNAKDYAKNIGLGLVGGVGGQTVGMHLFGKGNNRPLARTMTSLATNQVAKSVYNQKHKEK